MIRRHGGDGGHSGTHLPETRDLLKTESLMETDRCRVLGVDPAQDRVFSEAGCAGQQELHQCGAGTGPLAIGTDVD